MPFQQPSLFNHGSPATPADILGSAKEFIKDRLYFTSLQREPPHYPNVRFFTIDNSLVYLNFYSDFGPSNLSHVIRFTNILNEMLANPLNQNKKICVYSSMDFSKRANAAFLMCAYMLIAFKMSPEEAFKPLVGTTPTFVPYRDAGYGPATYHITILDCLRGLHKGLTTGLLDLQKFDLDQYSFYERVENGDLNFITDKFIAFASPQDDPPILALYTNYSQMQNKAGSCGNTTVNAWQQPNNPVQQKSLYSAYKIEEQIKYFKENDVRTVIRLNNKLYDRQKFLDAGIDHIEMYFPDGTTPPDGILKRFLDICENTKGVIAIHCKAGLGRTGSLIASYLMKHYKFTAPEIISFLRIMRPGSVVGPQQNYLQSMQAKLWKLHPITVLPSAISNLKPSTFYMSKRFSPAIAFNKISAFGDIQANLQIDNESDSPCSEFEQPDEDVIMTDINDAKIHRGVYPGETIMIPVQPRKHLQLKPKIEENNTIGRPATAALEFLEQTAAAQKNGSWKRAATAPTTEVHMGRLSLTNSVGLALNNVATQGTQTRYNLRSAVGIQKSKSPGFVTAPNEVTQFVLTGVGQPLVSVVPTSTTQSVAFQQSFQNILQQKRTQKK